MQIAFTGPRYLSAKESSEIWEFLREIAAENWHVGDAPGLDTLVQRAAICNKKKVTVYEVQGHQRWHFAERSKRMIDAIAVQPNSKLYAFPNKPCPSGCKPEASPNGSGSGTWLTIAYAKYKGLEIEIYQMGSFELPDWLQMKQLRLF